VAKISNVYELIQSRLGIEVQVEGLSHVVSIGTASQVVFPFNTRRVWVCIINLGDYDVYLRPLFIASEDYGIYLTPNGGMIAFNVEDDYILPMLEWHAISIGDSSDCFRLGVEIK
jgi:hypothetical protein